VTLASQAKYEGHWYMDYHKNTSVTKVDDQENSAVIQ